MKYLHICTNSPITIKYLEFMNKNFSNREHKFITEQSKRNIIFCIKDGINLYNEMKESERIYFHGLFNPSIILFLFIFKKFLKKSYWIIWGGDLYCFLKEKKGFKKKLYYKVANNVKGHFYGYITHIEGDYKLAKEWYGAKGKYFNCFMYPSNLYKEIKLNKIEKEDIYIQIGNSADPTNNHFEIFKKLEKLKNENIKLYCPLSYGNMQYAKEVIKKGKEIFKDSFIPLTEFMEYDKYLKFLSKIDIAIFAHDRQQAVGNITSLLSMKKTVYLKGSVTSYKMLKELGVKVKDFNKLKNLEKFNDNFLEKNKEIIKKRFSEKRLVEDWKKIFEDDVNVKN